MNAEFPLAVHALVYLTHKKQQVSSNELANNICTNPARVRKVMVKLCNYGLASVAHGKGSGYQALPYGESITLKMVCDALEENIITIHWSSGNIDKECLVSSGMSKIMDGIYQKMNFLCFEYLGSETIGSITQKLFPEKT